MNFNLETAISAWRHQFKYQRFMLKEDLDELERHLRDMTKERVTKGQNEEAAFRAAMQELGNFGGTDIEYRKVYWGKLKRRHQLLNEISWTLAMLKNDLTVTLRMIFSNKGKSFINISGLAIGMACALLVLLWVQDELSFDHFNENAEQIYRIEQDQFPEGRRFHVAATSPLLAPILEAEIPGLEAVTRMTSPGRLLVGSGDVRLYESSIRAVDPSFLTMFSFPLDVGDIESALSNPSSIILSHTLVEKYYGAEDPIGQTLSINGEHELTVTGILKDVPSNSSLQFEGLVPLEFLRPLGNYHETWSNWLSTFVQLSGPTDVALMNDKVTTVYRNHRDASTAEMMIVPLTDLRLYTSFGYNPGAGRIRDLYIFAAIGLLILVVACVNFMNLSTAVSSRRAKEIGMRKVSGAFRRQIVTQFLRESILLTFIALAAALLIAGSLLGPFNELTNKAFTVSSILRVKFIALMIGVAIATGLAAGSYPAIILSRFKPVAVLKGTQSGSAKGGLMRKVLVTFQFSASVALIIVTVVVFRQWHFMQKMDLGYDVDGLIMISLGEATPDYNELKEAWTSQAGVRSVTASSQALSMWISDGTGARWVGKSPDAPNPVIYMNQVDYDYLETVGIDLKDGRSFSRDHPSDMGTDSTGAWLINEKMADVIGDQSVIDLEFEFWGTTGPIIGVVEDFHFLSVQRELGPLAINLRQEGLRYALISYNTSSPQETMAALEAEWEKIVPLYPFEYSTLSENITDANSSVAGTGWMITYAAALIILIACLGLFGLISFIVEQRRKEIGIRKVLGSTSTEVVILLSKGFAGVIGIAILIGSVLGYMAANRFLDSYAYRTPIGFDLFAICGLIAMSIALFTVGYKSVRASLANPADSIRYE